MKRSVLLYASCLLLTAAFVVWQILQPRNDWLYPVLCAALMLAGLTELILRRPPKLFFLILLCLVYLKLPMVWRGRLGSAAWLRDKLEHFYVPVGCVVYWIVRMVQIRFSHGKKKQESSCA